MSKDESNYIENDERNGLKYNWELILKEYRKLGIPKELFTADKLPLEKATYFMLLSERATGKTTNLLLLGMIMHKIYGTTIEYIRQKEDMIKPSNALELFNVIISYNNGYYIEQLTGGVYNSIVYHWKKYYYAKTDYDGKVIEKSEKPFCHVLSIDNNFNYKSTYNAPKGDFIIYDEFIGKIYPEDEFVTFMDLLSTIIRKRKSAKIFMLANTISITSPYFKEMEVYQYVKKFKAGDSALMRTPRGTDVFFHIISTEESMKKQAVNRKYFGFQNEKLAGITGSSTYAIEIAPHIPKHEEFNDVGIKLVIETDLGMYRLKLVHNETLGIVVLCRPETRYDITIDRYYTNDLVFDKRKYKGMKWDKYDELLIKLKRCGRWYYDSNETATVVSNYLNIALANYNTI